MLHIRFLPQAHRNWITAERQSKTGCCQIHYHDCTTYKGIHIYIARSPLQNFAKEHTIPTFYVKGSGMWRQTMFLADDLTVVVSPVEKFDVVEPERSRRPDPVVRPFLRDLLSVFEPFHLDVVFDSTPTIAFRLTKQGMTGILQNCRILWLSQETEFCKTYLIFSNL